MVTRDMKDAQPHLSLGKCTTKPQQDTLHPQDSGDDEECPRTRGLGVLVGGESCSCCRSSMVVPNHATRHFYTKACAQRT